jgi:antitoxin HicB
MPALYKIPLVLEPQPEGGYTVTSPGLPELLTEGDTVEEALANVQDALQAVIEIYEEQGRALPAEILKDPEKNSIQFEHLVRAA